MLAGRIKRFINDLFKECHMTYKIQLTDDSAMMRSILKNFIQKSGLECTFVEAVDGRQGVEVYKREKPDVVFMDIMMPNMNGIDAADEIKKLDKNAKIVMCTSVKEKGHEEKAADIGVSGYIIKPFSSEQVNAIIKKII
jgi:two-component system chemotaxis response regulator CheY